MVRDVNMIINLHEANPMAVSPSNNQARNEATVHLEPTQEDKIIPPDIVDASQVKLSVSGEGKRVALFCSSYSDIPVSCFEASKQVAILLAQYGCALVYGGGSWGLMGVVASTMDACYKSQSKLPPILGVCPRFMMGSAGRCYGQTIITEGMAQRKKCINQFADVFLVLPGGFGTMDEMTEMITWNQVGLMNKLVAIFNVDGFYDGWWEWCQRAVRDGFIKPVFVENIIISSNPEDLVQQIIHNTPKPIPGKFITKA